MTRAILSVVVVMASVSVCAADDCNQSYSPWMQSVSKDGVYYYCEFKFEPQPGREVRNWVVWYPTVEDAGYFYFSNDKSKYWCRALNEYHKAHDVRTPRWNVIAKNENKLPLLNNIPKDAWGGPEHPVCPGSKRDGGEGCPMLKPPPAPKQMYEAYLASRR